MKELADLLERYKLYIVLAIIVLAVIVVAINYSQVPAEIPTNVTANITENVTVNVTEGNVTLPVAPS